MAKKHGKHEKTPPPIGILPIGNPAPGVFTVEPADVGAGAGAAGSPGTMTFDFLPISDTADIISGNASWTAVTAPLTTDPPVQVLDTGARNSVIIAVPADGLALYIGPDDTLTMNNGQPIHPGNQVTMSGYIGPIWALSSSAAATLFYQTT